MWKKEGVSVGYAYDKNATEAGQQRFKGIWVTHAEQMLHLEAKGLGGSTDC